MSAVPQDDRGLLLADGLFETILFKAGRPALWTAHLDRLARGCAVLGLTAPDADRAAADASDALAAADLSGARAAVRLTWTAGSGGRGLERPESPAPRLIVSAAASAKPEGPARLALSAIRRNAFSPTARLKSLAYLDNVLARRAARTAGAEEALMLNGEGELCGGAASNLFWIRGERLFTPALACGVLDGILRGRVLEAAPALGLEPVEIRAGLAMLEGASALFLSNSLIGVRPVAALDGRPMGVDGRVQGLARALAEFS